MTLIHALERQLRARRLWRKEKVGRGRNVDTSLRGSLPNKDKAEGLASSAMAHQHHSSIDSLANILSCSNERYLEFYNGGYSTEILCTDAAKIINKHRPALQRVHPRIKLDALLLAMMTESISDLGRRYVAAVLHVAQDSGGEAVVGVARAWLDYLFHPMLAIFKREKPEPSSSQTPTLDDSSSVILGASRGLQASLREQVLTRDRRQCVLTGTLDAGTVWADLEASIPTNPRLGILVAAHILPYCFNNFQEDCRRELKDAARTWDMLKSWTCLDLNKLAGEKLMQPQNAILLNSVGHLLFVKFALYFDKDAFPWDENKYKVRFPKQTMLSNGERSPDLDVLFVATNGIPCPDPEFLRIHAAFAKVLHLSGVAEYVESVERNAEGLSRVCITSVAEFSEVLAAKLQKRIASTRSCSQKTCSMIGRELQTLGCDYKGVKWIRPARFSYTGDTNAGRHHRKKRSRDQHSRVGGTAGKPEEPSMVGRDGTT